MRDQSVKRVLKYLKVAAMQDLILKTDPEKGTKCYAGANFNNRWNQEEDTDPGLVLYRKVYLVTYSNYPIKW